MHVGVSALFQAHGGIVTYLRQLLDDWGELRLLSDHQLTLFLSKGAFARLRNHVPDGAFTVLLPEADKGFFGRFVAEQILLPRMAVTRSIDVLFCPASTMPYAAGMPCVVAFPNAAPLCPTISRSTVGLRTWLRFRLLGLFITLSARRTAHLVLISRYFQALLEKQIGGCGERVSVIYRSRTAPSHSRPWASDPTSVGSARRHYMLCVSHFYRYKNLLELVRGYATASRQLGRSIPDLLIAGAPFDRAYYREVAGIAERLSFGDGKVQFLGEVRHDEIGGLLANCQFMIFPSTCENCPNALVEGLSLGVPIACSNTGVMPEIVGQAALYFDPYDPTDIARAIVALTTEAGLREELSRRGLAEAQRFPSSREVAAQTLAVILEAGSTRTGTTTRRLG